MLVFEVIRKVKKKKKSLFDKRVKMQREIIEQNVFLYSEIFQKLI